MDENEKSTKNKRIECWLLISTLVALLLAIFGITTVLSLRTKHVTKRQVLLDELESYRHKHFSSKVTMPQPGIVVGGRGSNGELVRALKDDFLATKTDPSTNATKQLESTRPHIVLILADDLGWADVGWHNQMVKTPNLERIMKQGRQLTNLYAHSTCSPSRAAILTGIYAWRMGLDGTPFRADEVNGIPLGVPLLAQRLKERDYNTHYVGKWHGGFCSDALTPTQRGFDSFYGFYSGVIHYNTHQHTISRRVSGHDYRQVDLIDNENNETILANMTGTHSTGDFASQAIKRIEQFDTSTDDRLFLTVSFNAPHFPYVNNGDESDTYGDIEMAPNRRRYLNLITEMDAKIGTIHDELIRRGLWENTILVFASDNGAPMEGGSNYPLRGGKGSMFDGGNKVPGFIASPLLKETGTTFNELVHFTDLSVTLQGAAGIKKSDKQDGVNYWPQLATGLEQQRRKSVFYHIDKKQRTQSEIGNNRDLANVLLRDKLEKRDTVYGTALRMGRFKFAKKIHNLRELLFPHAIVDEFATVVPPSELGTGSSSESDPKPYDKGFRTENYDHWLFDLVNDPDERFNLLVDGQLDLADKYYFLEMFHNFVQLESDKMITPVSDDSEANYRLPDGALVNGTWVTGWCDSKAMKEANLYYKL